jgi:hypothetical protein
MSKDQTDLAVAACNQAIMATAVRALRKIQSRVERENRDLDIDVSIFALRGDDGDIRVVLDGRFFSEIDLWSHDSPRCWLRIIRGVIRDGRRELELRRREPSNN